MCVTKQIKRAPAIGMIVAFILSITNVIAADDKAVKKEVKTAFHVPLGQRQLFLDDYGVAKIENVTRTMHRPVKKGAVIRPDCAIGEDCIQGRTAPVWDRQKKVFKFWTLYGPPEVSDASGYYESKDGLHWYKPVVGQLEYHGSRNNNYVTVPLGGGRMGRPAHVVYDESDPDPARRFKCFLPATGLAVSPDGITWKRLDGVSAVPSGDESNFSFDEKTNLFIATVKHDGPYGRAVFLSTSKDFEHWTKPELIFHADERDQELGRENIKARLADPTLHQPSWKADPAVYKVDVYNMGVFRYEGLYIGMPAMFHSTSPVPNYPNTDGFHLVQLLCSRDLHKWQRLGDRQPFIGPSRLGSGAYDLTQILPPSSAVVYGDELWFYYTGIKYRATFTWEGDYPEGHYVWLPGFDPDKGAICLAVLRRDGFISLDAGEQKGTILTEPFTAPGMKLFVNVDAHKGELRTEVLDKHGKVLATTAAMKGDLLQGEVRWQKGNIADFKAEVVSIRFTLRNAAFYSYWFDQN